MQSQQCLALINMFEYSLSLQLSSPEELARTAEWETGGPVPPLENNRPNGLSLEHEDALTDV